MRSRLALIGYICLVEGCTSTQSSSIPVPSWLSTGRVTTEEPIATAALPATSDEKSARPGATALVAADEDATVPDFESSPIEFADWFDAGEQPAIEPAHFFAQETPPDPLSREIEDAEAIPFPRQGIPVPPGDLSLPITESPEQQPVRRPGDLTYPGTGYFIRLDDVIGSVYTTYPLLLSAMQERQIAAGQQLTAAGAWDLRLKGASESGPTGYYQTYRNSVSLVQPSYGGGEVFAGYRNGRGFYQPWYLERQTNDGGEFRAGVMVPLSRNRQIDQRRATLWKSTYERQVVEPEIQAQLIDFVLEASYAYWNWVAAGQYYLVDARVLQLAQDRTSRIQRQVELELIDPPQLTDNYRLIAVRKAAVAESARKYRESGVKLSLFYRDGNGEPIIPTPEVLPNFPDPHLIEIDRMHGDIQVALAQRPELKVYDLVRRQLDVDLAQANNEFRPSVDMMVAGSQDMGAPTSYKRDKSQFELEAGIFADVAIQRRQARGKMAAVEAKLAQVGAKRRMTEDKIVADVQAAYAALVATYEAVKQSILAVELAEDLAERERRNFENGLSDLLTVTLREQFEAESAFRQVEALKQYYHAVADYRAALAQDQVPGEMLPIE